MKMFLIIEKEKGKERDVLRFVRNEVKKGKCRKMKEKEV